MSTKPNHWTEFIMIGELLFVWHWIPLLIISSFATKINNLFNIFKNYYKPNIFYFVCIEWYHFGEQRGTHIPILHKYSTEMLSWLFDVTENIFFEYWVSDQLMINYETLSI